MGYQDDPDINRRNMRTREEGWSAGSIILASLAALAVVFGIFFMMSDRNSNVANRTDRPAVTTGSSTVTTPTITPAQPRAVEAPAQSGPATTTGSGAAR